MFFSDASVFISFLSENATMPTMGTLFSAGCDLYGANTEKIIIHPHETVKIPTDIAIDLPRYTFGAIFARSGIATKRGLRPSNCVGVIDSDYRGNVIVALHNDTEEKQIIEPKERIAQLIIVPYLKPTFYKVDKLSETARGDGSFGSTGTK